MRFAAATVAACLDQWRRRCSDHQPTCESAKRHPGAAENDFERKPQPGSGHDIERQ